MLFQTVCFLCSVYLSILCGTQKKIFWKLFTYNEKSMGSNIVVLDPIDFNCMGDGDGDGDGMGMGWGGGCSSQYFLWYYTEDRKSYRFEMKWGEYCKWWQNCHCSVNYPFPLSHYIYTRCAFCQYVYSLLTEPMTFAFQVPCLTSWATVCMPVKGHVMHLMHISQNNSALNCKFPFSDTFLEGFFFYFFFMINYSCTVLAYTIWALIF